VTVRKSLWLAAVGLCLAQAPRGSAADPAPTDPVRLAPVPSARVSNQQMADAIAANLRQSGQLRRYCVDVSYRSGTAELTGVVVDQPQREEVLRIVQGVPGVERVLDRLTLANSVRPVAADLEEKPGGQPPTDLPKLPPPLKEGGPAAPPDGAPPGQPTPIFQAPPGVPYGLNPPKMPPYAWPTYAPYNNYSRVAYPTAYPYNAFPFIGPQYPFPKVPLGWRSVKLEFEDGYWWFSKTASKYDWWHLRYR
jgi:BON domain